jgi:hypothetical protein
MVPLLVCLHDSVMTDEACPDPELRDRTFLCSALSVLSGTRGRCFAHWYRSRHRTVMFGMSVLLSSLAPVAGEVSLVRSHSVMAVRS